MRVCACPGVWLRDPRGTTIRTLCSHSLYTEKQLLPIHRILTYWCHQTSIGQLVSARIETPVWLQSSANSSKGTTTTPYLEATDPLVVPNRRAREEKEAQPDEDGRHFPLQVHLLDPGVYVAGVREGMGRKMRITRKFATQGCKRLPGEWGKRTSSPVWVLCEYKRHARRDA